VNKLTLEKLRVLDRKYANEDIPLHQRPFLAAIDILGIEPLSALHRKEEIDQIAIAYQQIRPDVETSWPGAGIGIMASDDHVRKIVFPIITGQRSLHPWQLANFSSADEWWGWCRQDHDVAASSHFSMADLHDLIMGINRIDSSKVTALKLWGLATSNLEDMANILPAAFSVDSVLQPIHLLTELAIKAALVWHGDTEESFSMKGGSGHNLKRLAERMASFSPHRDDARIMKIIETFPPYVKSRYNPTGLSRLSCVKLAIESQFIASSTLRRTTQVDLAGEMELENFPGQRPDFS
jgi:hypothetical protein